MRQLVAVPLAMVAIAATAVAQDSPTQEKLLTYRFNVSVPVTRCTFDGQPEDDATPTYAPGGSQFVYIRDLVPSPAPAAGAKSVVVLQFLDWEDPAKFALFNAMDVSNNMTAEIGRKTFCVDKTIVDRTTERTYAWGWSSWDLAAGVLLLPIKMRISNFDFSRDVTIGTVFGPRWRLSPTRNVFLSFLAGAGIAAVQLDSASTGGVVRQPTDRAAVTLALGPMLEMNGFQVGALLDWDRISNAKRDQWAYQGKPWLSLGLGYSLLRAAPDAPATGQKK